MIEDISVIAQREIKVGIIGYGYATRTFHAPLIMACPGLKLVSISSSDENKVRADFPDINSVAVENTAQALMQRTDVDLVIVPTPNDTHYSLAEMALTLGKHVVVDKPFTVKSAEARRLTALAREKELILSVFHNRRFDGDFLTVKTLLSENTLGRVMHFESHFDRYRPVVQKRWRESEAVGSGIWYDLGSHLLDQTVQLFGRPDSIQLQTMKARDNSVATDYFHAVLRYENDASTMLAILHASTLAATAGARFSLHGTKGSYTKYGLDEQEDLLKKGIQPGSSNWFLQAQQGQLKVSVDGKDELVKKSLLNKDGDYLAYYAGLREAINGNAPNPVSAEDAAYIITLLESGLAGTALLLRDRE